ncbi:type III-B CRISPR module RAMP protein Cmr6 [Chitinispirillales bacterium ANBcel5]|uniref:type III-B CRISPR module RAMP protein Cmr6 n=1 Tax=Cellulosispirillum alkaliphilum TaxID=3039283 RepID=UPI002A521B53|nr:type III-B CRISPR module RAMP protein Cmr6 [Chitinispirillales bacterium ANBcel5]
MATQSIRDDHKVEFNLSNTDTRCQNFGLWFDKLLPETYESDEHVQKSNAIKFFTKSKGSEVHKTYKYAFDGWIESIKNRNDIIYFDIISTTRVILGSGNSSGLEIGLQLNKPWGVPYISGNTFKGLLSSYLNKYGGDDWKRFKDTKSSFQVEIFGGVKNGETQSYSGSVIFNDAWIYPEHNSWYESDIINVHYSKYYSKEKMPNGMENPKPIKTLVLKPELRFFVSLQGDLETIMFLKKIIAKALKEEGIGSKTSVGYGRFEILLSEEERDSTVIGKIKSATTAEELAEIYKSHKKNTRLKDEFRIRLKHFGYSDSLKEMWKNLKPLELLLKELEDGKFGNLQAFNKAFKETEEKKLLAGVDANQTKEGQALFDAMLKRWKNSIEKQPEMKSVKILSYGWESVKLSDDLLLDIVTGKTVRVWPPLRELRHFLEKCVPAGCTAEGIAMVLEELQEKQ